MKRNRYVDLRAPAKRVNHALADKHRGFAGLEGYETSRVDLRANEVIAAYRQLIKIEKVVCGVSQSDLRARPIFHHKVDCNCCAFGGGAWLRTGIRGIAEACGSYTA